MTKTEVRTKVKEYLKNAREKNMLSGDTNLLMEKLFALPQFNETEILLAYIPCGGEADCIPAIEKSLESGKTVCIPRVKDDCLMDFYILSKDLPLSGQLKKGAFGILEPADGLEKFIPEINGKTEKTLFMIVPGVAFTTGGKRCGHGKGYYDRYIPALKKSFKNLFLCGLCHDFQIFDDIPVDQYDVLMDKVIF